MPSYDLLVYHDLDDPIHDRPPEIGQDASAWFGKGFEGLFVTVVGPGIHDGRVRVVLAAEHRPDMQHEIKEFFGQRKE